jgi:enoyl-CoA hydratase
MTVELIHEDGVGFVTLSRPPANSYDRELVEALGAALDQAVADERVRVVVVRSAVERFFSAGADVKAFSENAPEVNMDLVRRAHEVFNGIAQIPMVVVAQIGGHALGGGLELALACDVRFAAEGRYRLGLPEVTLGLLPGTGGTQRLPRLVGVGKALELMVSGTTFTPDEAHRLGVVDRLVPAEELDKQTLEFARSLVGGAPLAIAAIKQAVHRGIDLPLPDALALERDLIEPLFASEDGKEGVAAFLEKRSPQFKGS